MVDRLEQQIAFIVEIDRLKTILRQSLLIDGSRRENSAEHSWQLAIMALVLAEHANEPVDAAHVAKLVLLHDIVEIDAGDVLVYDVAGNADKEEREQKAADRIYGLLPDEQARELRALWDEFEAAETAEAKFARSLDRLMPLLHNYHTEGARWQKNGIVSEQVWKLNRSISNGSERLAEFAGDVIEKSIEAGYLPKG